MAELLVRIGSVPPLEDGDVIAVAEDGWTWGRNESIETWVAEGRRAAEFPGRHAVVKYPGVAASRMRHLLDVEWPEGSDPERDPEVSPSRQRAVRVVIDDLPTRLRDPVVLERMLSVTDAADRAALEDRVRRKADGEKVALER